MYSYGHKDGTQSEDKSGADVPIANMVNPMNRGDSLNILAILTLEFISLSAENHSKNSHIISIIMARIMIFLDCDNIKVNYNLTLSSSPVCIFFTL